MQLTDNKIVVKKCSNKTAGGIFVPELGQKVGNALCEVLSVGPGVWNPYKQEYKAPEVKVGDRVVINLSVLAEINVRTDKEKPVDQQYICSASDVRIILDEGENI